MPTQDTVISSLINKKVGVYVRMRGMIEWFMKSVETIFLATYYNNKHRRHWDLQHYDVHSSVALPCRLAGQLHVAPLEPCNPVQAQTPNRLHLFFSDFGWVFSHQASTNWIWIRLWKPNPSYKLCPVNKEIQIKFQNSCILHSPSLQFFLDVLKRREAK